MAFGRDAEMLAWLEVDRIAMRVVFEDPNGPDEISFTSRTWVTPWDRWASLQMPSEPLWRRSWAQVVALARGCNRQAASDARFWRGDHLVGPSP